MTGLVLAPFERCDALVVTTTVWPGGIHVRGTACAFMVCFDGSESIAVPDLGLLNELLRTLRPESIGYLCTKGEEPILSALIRGIREGLGRPDEKVSENGKVFKSDEPDDGRTPAGATVH